MWFNERKSTFNLITTLKFIKSVRKLRMLEENLSIINKKIIVETGIISKK